jgi:hypothetical protein
MNLIARILSGVMAAEEEEANGEVVREIEHVVYGRLLDLTQLIDAASRTHQEQWQVRIAKTDTNAASGCFRIRKVVEYGSSEAQYVFTTKTTVSGPGDKLELSTETDEVHFKMFQQLSDHGMIKDRYVFPVPNTDLKWEFDLFLKPDGGYYEWVKIDLEVPSKETPLPDLPIKLEDVIYPVGQGREADATVDAFVTELYEKFFLTKNVFLNGQ